MRLRTETEPKSLTTARAPEYALSSTTNAKTGDCDSAASITIHSTLNCKVVVKRGVLTPWGTIAWSTYSAIQRLSAKGNGAITYNRWE